MGVVEKLSAVVVGETEFERLGKRLESLQAERERLTRQLDEETERLAQALLDGGQEAPQPDPALSLRLQAVDRAIVEVRRRMERAEAEHVRTRLAAIGAEMAAMSKEYERRLKEYEKARREFEAAERKWLQFSQVEHLPRVERLKAEHYDLERRLQELEGGEAA